MKPAVALSPHLDDAVFSCWHLLRTPGTEVVTVFAGIPSEGTKTFWDFVCGEPNGAKMMRERRKENDAIFKTLGVSIRNLEYLDTQYHPSPRDVPEIARTVLAGVDADAVFYAPLAGSRLWRHPDHITVRKIGEYLTAQGRDVFFYADIPYMQMPVRPDTGYARRLELWAGHLLGGDVKVEITELTHDETVLKRKAMHQYGTQYMMTNLGAVGTLGRIRNSAREVTLKII